MTTVGSPLSTVSLWKAYFHDDTLRQLTAPLARIQPLCSLIVFPHLS